MLKSCKIALLSRNPPRPTVIQPVKTTLVLLRYVRGGKKQSVAQMPHHLHLLSWLTAYCMYNNRDIVTPARHSAPRIISFFFFQNHVSCLILLTTFDVKKTLWNNRTPLLNNGRPTHPWVI